VVGLDTMRVLVKGIWENEEDNYEQFQLIYLVVVKSSRYRQ
jgi:hypothetical protein